MDETIYPYSEGWWESAYPDTPPPADRWLYQIGEQWMATRGEDEALWFRDTDADAIWTPKVRSYPIDTIPPAGRLIYRDATGAERIAYAAVSALSAGLRAGMSDESVKRYIAAITERDDYLEWRERPPSERGPWVIWMVPVPDDAPRMLDTEYGYTGRFAEPGVFVYDDEPDCVVSLAHVEGRFVPAEGEG